MVGGGGRGLKISEKSLLGRVRNFYFGAGGGGEGAVILLVGEGGQIIKLTNLIYFRDFSKMHLLSSEETSFSMAICRKCFEHLVVFPVDLS